VPQYPTPNRYQEWWFWKFKEEFEKAGFEVLTLGDQYVNMMEKQRGDESNFSPIVDAIKLEAEQIKEYSCIVFHPDDILFVADISFPGIFCNVLYHNPAPKMFAFCHATSLNKYDYFERVRNVKFPVETSHAAMFDKVFVGSEYHAKKLNWPNTVVTSLPSPDHLRTFKNETKVFDVVSASRLGKQKVNSKLEAKVEERFGKIVRKQTETAEQYYKFLGQSKILLITSHEDTFGYQIVDAINNNCIPIARYDLSYPELLPRNYLYKDENELFELINTALWGMIPVPRLKCREQMHNFYNKLIKEMTEVNHPF